MNKKTIVLSFISFLLTAHVIAQAPRSYTSSEILLQLKKLNTVGSVLYVAAHPDDENTRLIAYLANEKCLRTGYLSLTRGDGGQNLIGPEQGVELGVIRTQELLAARRIDGGEQFFTRAYDFGFSKSPEETLQKWNKDSILSDMVWVIRNFRPDIIITRFATDGSGGHGHHTTSAILAEEAFDAAGDPTRFPEQLQYVEVWKPRRLFWNVSTRFQNPNADMSPYIKLDVGGYNPLLGKSYGEIAAESRSMHKSQGFGSAKQRGEYFEYFKPIKGDTANLKDIFEGIDFSWKRMKGGKLVEANILEVINNFNSFNPNSSVENLKNIRNTKGLINSSYHRELIANIEFLCDGYFYEHALSQPTYSVNEQVKIYTSKIKRGLNNSGKMKIDTFVSKCISTSELYWLEAPITNNMFHMSSKYSLLNNDQPNGILSITLINNETHLLRNKYQHIYKLVDPEKGELYRPVVITPPVMINPQSKLLTFTDNKTKELRVNLKAGKDSVSGLIQIALPKGWYVVLKGSKFNNQLKAPTESAFTFSLAKKGDVEEIVIEINPYEGAQDTTISITALVNGQTYTKGIKEIKYDHIPVQTLFPEAEVKLVKLDVVKKSKRIGYIPGAGDEVQACLSQLGYEVVTLTDDKLASENLSSYDAIITGVRAYNTNEKLLSFKQKLMDYVAAGGNLIVQYNTNSWAGPLSSDIGPYKFKITRNRITNEDAKVNFLLPNHPVFNSPNKITENDFEDWIQERSIYHAGDWDSNYVAPISMTDPYEMTIGGVSPKGKPDNGALIIAKHGKGNFVYTGLVFFRQLPAGVPGAYRFLVNLIELGR
jgi:LmbE family N-acetylglucosaminyl deacetylase